MSLSKRHILAV